MLHNKPYQALLATLQRHAPIALLCTVFVITAIAGDELTLLLRYEREAIIGGQFYRLISGHFVHLNWPHSLMNIAAALIGWLLFAHTMSKRLWYVSIFSAALLISLLLLCLPQLQWYLGFSGIIHCLMLLGLLLDPQLTRPWKSLLVTALLAKVCYEVVAGASVTTTAAIEAAVVIEAHIFGLLSGALLFGLHRPLSKALDR